MHATTPARPSKGPSSAARMRSGNVPGADSFRLRAENIAGAARVGPAAPPRQGRLERQSNSSIIC
jgi:hypothetical protein